MRHPYADFAHEVERPVRYLGGEYGQVVKDLASVSARVVLAFPDTYEIGMSHLGTKILYGLLNGHEAIACERAFAPWADLEAQLRTRNLPLVSLESARPLCEFDVVGISLQFELCYTNVLTLLDLGGIPLRAEARTMAHPLVLGGGPNALHPEPVAAFFDAFFIGEAEEELPALVLEWAALRRAGTSRRDALATLAARYALYVPALYEVREEPLTGCLVVDRPNDDRAPRRVRRALVENLDKFPFPALGPVPWAEAVFDRAAVEIARGCTEGCRFCQAGMIYRPVRERSPDSIIASILGGVDRAGYDETSLTCLSTADVSCITPLVKEVMVRLRARKVALAVSSLRAYGLNEELLDELASVRATGLTFAPEAGTQRMRDVINKNVTEDHIRESAERVFRKGWSRLKLYFMIGQPTETDEDVRGIVETGARMLAIGQRAIGHRAEVTVSVSSHVPKPHTPFQWCRMDPPDELERKQVLLRDVAKSVRPHVKLKMHQRGPSFVEGILSRGDRRLADVIEWAWRDGARFDTWDELFELSRWQRAFAACGLDPARYLGTIPVEARLSWDHLDIGLEDSFLLDEYRRALKDRLSPPCGKPFGTLLHPTNVADTDAEARRLVCYDCGVACDLGRMREERRDFLVQLGATDRPLEPSPEERSEAERERKSRSRRKPEPAPQFVQGEGTRWRFRYTKLGRAAFISHLDVNRLLQRVLRRAGITACYTVGFHPKTDLTFGPALALGVPSLGELVEVRLDGEFEAADLLERLGAASPESVRLLSAARVAPGQPSMGQQVNAADWLLRPRGAAPDLALLAQTYLARDAAPVERGDKIIDTRRFVLALEPVADEDARRFCDALGWEPGPLLRGRVIVGPNGSVRPTELARAVGLDGADLARLGCVGLSADGSAYDPLSPPPVVPRVVSAKKPLVSPDVGPEQVTP